MTRRTTRPDGAEKTVRDIRRATRRQYSAEEKIRVVLEGLRSEASIAELCRKEGIAASMYYGWSKELLEAGKRRLAGDTAREATSDEVRSLRAEMRQLKEALAETTLESRLLKKKRSRGWGGYHMRYPSSEKLEIIRTVETSATAGAPHGGADRHCEVDLLCLADRYAVGGLDALEDRRPRPGLRAGGALTDILAFGLGAVHALTPGHGKSALAAYFFGHDARFATGIRVALTAALFHVAMGFLTFFVLRLLANQVPTMTARGSPAFSLMGYGLILVAGFIMVYQSLPPTISKITPRVLTVGVGMLPCPLTITVLGFAWAQGSGVMIAVVLIALAAGIAFTIGIVAALAIAGRQFFGYALMHRMPAFERSARTLQGIAGTAIVGTAAYALRVNL